MVQQVNLCYSKSKNTFFHKFTNEQGDYCMKDNTKIKLIDELLEKTDIIRLSNPEKTIELAKKAIALSKEVGYNLGIAVANFRIADSYRNLGKYEDAIVLLLDSLDFFIKESLYDLQWSTYNCLGIIFGDLGDYERSMNFYNKSEIVANQIDSGKKYNAKFTSKEAIVITLNNIAENYKLLKDYKEALAYCNSAYNIDKEQNFQLSKGITVLSLGEIYYLLNYYKKATTLAHSALKYLRYYNYTLAESDAYKLMALAYWKQEDFANAEKYFEITINMNKKQATSFYEIDAFLNYYEFLESRQHFDNALNALTHAFDLSMKNNELNKISQISGLLGVFYEKLNNKNKAFEYYKIHYNYYNKLLGSFNNQMVKNLNIRNRMQKIEKEMTVKNENLKKQSEDLQTVVEKISIISKLGQKITATTNLNSIIDILDSSIKSFMDLTYFAIGLYDEKRSVINYLDAIENNKKIKKSNTSMDNKHSFATKCIETSEIIIINDMSKEYSKYIDDITYEEISIQNHYEINSLVFLPLLINTKVIGVLTIQSSKKDVFNSYQIEMVKSLSSYAAIAINNALKSRELENLNKELLFLSQHDSMTKIYNRGKFDTYLNDVWNKSLTEKSSISLILLDIDYFKEYNDNYGHVAGDNCILKVASFLHNLTKDKYFIARYGGDEFIIVLPNTLLQEALYFGKIIKTEINNLSIPHEFSELSNIVTLSIGVASIIPNSNNTINEFIKKTDDALYCEKNNRTKDIVIKG